MRCPALLIAAPASGQGKTTVTAALARLLVRRGARVRAFKCGPDFVDPGWLALASGAPVHNLDLWMSGEADMRARLHAAACAADAILVEGVMGLHDGTPSSADVARRLGLPVLAVVQAGAMAQTLGALVQGLRDYGAGCAGALPWAGVLANGVAGAGHAELLRGALRPADGWLGHLPPSDALHVAERALGLTPAGELAPAAALARLDAAADLLAATLLGQLDLADWRARWSIDFAAPPAAAPLQTPLAGRTVAVARDAAFAFIYPANIELLQALGARVAFFSPLAGDRLPACDALWLPGGYPERHAARLAACADLCAQLHAHAQAGRPIWAEGGGTMVLMDELVDADGAPHALWGLMPGRARLLQRLAGLGLQQWQPLAPVAPLRGHAFHHGVVETALAPIGHTAPAAGSARGQGEAIYAAGPAGRVRASFFHPWWPSSPRAAAWLFGAEWPASADAVHAAGAFDAAT